MTKNLFNVFVLWVLCAALLIFCFTVAASAQAKEDNKEKAMVRPAHVGFIYPLSTNGLEAAACTNGFSLHVLAGVSRNEQAFCLSGIASIVKEHAAGAMISGVVNYVQGDVNGAQIAGVANTAGNADGIQIAGVVNTAGDAQVQVAGLANIAHNTDGLQVAGFANVSKDAVCQVAGFINTAGDAGNQVAGFINIARKVRGIQLAGFMNIAEESDYPIGIVNIIKKGEKQVGLSIDETGTPMATFRSGGRILYGIIGLGINPEHEDARYALEGGLGAHIPLAKMFRVNIEGASTVWSDIDEEVYFRASLRALAALKVTKDIELFAGPTFNHLQFEEGKKDKLVNNFIWERSRHDNFNGLYIGFLGGIQVNL